MTVASIHISPLADELEPNSEEEYRHDEANDKRDNVYCYRAQGTEAGHSGIPSSCFIVSRIVSRASLHVCREPMQFYSMHQPPI